MFLKDIFNRVRPFLWFLPGFLLWAAFPPYGEKIDVLFALAPLIYLSRTAESVRGCVRRWFAAGFFFWVATLAWMPAIVKNGGPWPLVILGLVGLAAYCAAYFALYGFFGAVYWRWARERERTWVWRFVGILLVEPVLWCGLELVRSRFLGGFSWNQLGVVAVNGGFGSPAAVGGVYLCSAAVFLVNGSIAGIIERAVESLRAQRERRAVAISRIRSLETLVVFAVIWGIFQIDGARTAGETSKFVKVALIQRNFPCEFKEREENPYGVYGGLLENIGALKPDLTVFAESAACEFGPVDQQGAFRFAAFVTERTGGSAVLMGGTRYEDGKTYNSAALYSAGGYQVYDKVHLVPFGEFIPGDKWFPALQRLAPVGSCTPGEPRLLKMGDMMIGVAICFEDTDSALLRKYAAMGAQMLVFITNDSWFSQSSEAVAHFWQAVARAVETGLPVVRVGNSGVTATISPDGRFSALSDGNGRPLVDQRGTMLDRLSVSADEKGRRPTVYVQVGDIPLTLAFSLILLIGILVYYRQQYEKRRYLSM